MKAIVPNYLYPLATDRQLQWTKQVVRGESEAKTPIRPKSFSAPKKNILRQVVKRSKLPPFGKPQQTRRTLSATVSAKLPEDPMEAPDPSPGNAMHIANTKAMYNGYQS